MTDCLFSSLRLWTNIECAYCVEIMLICWNVFFILFRGSLSVVSRFTMDGIIAFHIHTSVPFPFLSKETLS